MYDKLFEWLIQVVNDALEAAQSAITQAQEGGSGERLYIGVLDIYGFEIFEKNGFEQVRVQGSKGLWCAHSLTCVWSALHQLRERAAAADIHRAGANMLRLFSHLPALCTLP